MTRLPRCPVFRAGVHSPGSALLCIGEEDQTVLDKALTIATGEAGVRKITVHRDSAWGHSAAPASRCCGD